ncbi:MAG: SDR family oxidoreductase [Burkholderiaceae bacterium]|nr:SDR family oxidoreductase [Burkholderiaceae bacterium]
MGEAIATGASALMQGRRGLVMGVANERSIAWGIARTLRAHGAELAFTYQGGAMKKRVAQLASDAGSELVLDCDVEREESIDASFDAIRARWGALDFVVHAVAHSSRDELKGRYVDTTLANFLHTMHVSCYSFTSVMRRAAALMPRGGAAITLSYYGAEKVMPNYNVMGVAKAALEASTRYLAADLGPQGIRVNAVSAGPMRTLSGAAVGSARAIYKYNVLSAPLRRGVELDELGGTALYLLSALGGAVTGEIHYVDCGFNALGMPQNLDEVLAAMGPGPSAD